MDLQGEKNGEYPDGIPCTTGILDHVGVTDYGGNFNSWVTFDGNNSQEDDNMMSSCHKVSPSIKFKTPFFIKDCF